MKKFNTFLILLIGNLLTGCVQSAFLENHLLSKKFVVISDVSNCTYISKVSYQKPPNTKKNDFAIYSAFLRLKGTARSKVKGGNALAEIRMTDRDFPIAEANVYQCPQEVFDKYKPLQDDKEFLYSNIKFDLPKPETHEEEKE